MRALSSLLLLFPFPIVRGLSFPIYIVTIKTTVSARTDTLLMCAPTWTTTMNTTHHQEKKKILTARSNLILLLRRCVTPATIQHPQQNLHGLQTYRRIQPLALQNGCGPTTKDSMESARQQAIQHWNLPKHPEYGSLARRTRTFYQGRARWDPEGEPCVGDVAQAGFYYDGGFTIIITII